MNGVEPPERGCRTSRMNCAAADRSCMTIRSIARTRSLRAGPRCTPARRSSPTCCSPSSRQKADFRIGRNRVVKMTLYGFWRSLATYRVRVALSLKGIEAQEVSVNLLKGAQHSADYQAVNPQNVVPALLVDDGPPLFQSLAILEYLEETYPEPPLLPRDPRGRAR